MNVKVLRVKGKYRGKGKKEYIPFIKEIRAVKEEDAIELIYSEIGSKHKAERRFIKIEEIEEITNLEEIKNRIVLDLTQKS